MCSRKWLGLLWISFFVVPAALAAQPAKKKSASKRAQATSQASPRHAVVQRARMAFQQKKYTEAIRLYRSIPDSDSAFLKTREELGWAYLQAGQWAELQGLARDLNTKVIPMSQRLEGRVLSAISELRLCHYQEVQKEIQKFQTEMLSYAKNLERKPNSTAKTNQLKMVQEAVLKMKFVRLELLNQLRLVQVLNRSGELAGLKLASADSDSLEESSRSRQMNFPVDESIWADEFLNKVSYQESSCASFQKSAKL